MLEPKLITLTQVRYFRNAKGQICSDSSVDRNSAWAPYLQVFNHIYILARVDNLLIHDGQLVESDRVTVIELPFYSGLSGLLTKYLKVRKVIQNSIRTHHGYVVSQPGTPFCGLLLRKARKLGMPFWAQLIGDPHESLKSGIIGKTGKLLAPIALLNTRRIVSQADAVSYVTLRTLQEKYPASNKAKILTRSNVVLTKDSFAVSPRNYKNRPLSMPVKLITIGSQAQRYKGHDTLLDAVKVLSLRGLLVSVTIVGEGKYHDELVKLSINLGLSDSVRFIKYVGEPKDLVPFFHSHDLFLLPSLTEGMPRVLIEAMASGIACLGSKVGGIPELLEPHALFEPGNPSELADHVQRATQNLNFLTSIAAEQYLRAKHIYTQHTGDELLVRFLKRWVSNT